MLVSPRHFQWKSSLKLFLLRFTHQLPDLKWAANSPGLNSFCSTLIRFSGREQTEQNDDKTTRREKCCKLHTLDVD